MISFSHPIIDEAFRIVLARHKFFIFRRIRKIVKATVSFVMSVCPSVCPRGKVQFPLHGFSWNLIYEYFSSICWENLSFIKTWQE
jgi:hypothetical protein